MISYIILGDLHLYYCSLQASPGATKKVKGASKPTGARGPIISLSLL